MNILDQNLLKAYLNDVSEKAAEHKLGKRELKLYTNSGFRAIRGQGWNRMPFKHPSTYHTLAFDPSIKKTIFNDLDRFKAGKDFYRQIGRAWKRGYLLHGPPGTGKSHNQELRALLTQTSEKVIIVIEDIDCSKDLTDRESKEKAIESKLRSQLTLSGLLNVTDGLWSCCEILTPAEIIEILMSKVDTPDKAVSNVISALDAKIKEKQALRQSQSSQTEKEEKIRHEGRDKS
ncbi:hypothetical protein SUGI_0500150 [Cryptomeria japonica]|nr:hypothetical protein SUGI_0500150 [Cryptomeria japonica]